ncbi:ABC transporter substrate-binding protein [Rhizobium lentis]|uniref:ABC transporter substrate-binding protein n=1 Tax=Rhizobium lentis TaxID=1138194 RepID=UPI001C833E2C|nr:ABC transporter substrate-binding protein [Rhizobium lentis]MBX5086778.1 ABC transporter substrate-binding protein [Rhizobium lentis]MBX5099423.1 ABC transporter substrate-binding protein [Rhizobium lentis]MBX5124340.1 ABC transporter substrate-binding protein [Rhizobium lentis]
MPATAILNCLHHRSFRTAAAAAVTCALVFLGGGVAAAQETVTFAGWGGSLQKAQRDVFFNTFEKETGIRVIDTTDTSYAKIKTMVTTGDVQWDVVQTLGMWTKPGEKDNLWEPLDYSVIDRKGIPDALAGKFTIGNSQYAIGLAYNKERLTGATAPKAWADFWDAEKFPGRRGWKQFPRYTVEAALMADGVPTSEVYPLDVDRAYKSLAKLKPNVSVWSRTAERDVQMLAGGEIAMGMSTHTRILDAQKEGIPLAFVWQGAVMTVDNLAVPRGAKNKTNAMKLINWMSKAENQARFAELTSVGPSNERALDLVADQVKQNLPTYHFQKGELVRFNDDWWADNIASMDEKYLVWAQGIK